MLVVELHRKFILSFYERKISLSCLHKSFPTLTTCCFPKISFNIIFLFYARDSGGELKGHFFMKANERLNDSAAHSGGAEIIYRLRHACYLLHRSYFVLPTSCCSCVRNPYRFTLRRGTPYSRKLFQIC